MELSLIKRNFKRKIKITEGLIIAFLITGNLSYANEISVDETINHGVFDSVINYGGIVSEDNLVQDKIEISNQNALNLKSKTKQLLNLENFGNIKSKISLKTKDINSTENYMDIDNSIVSISSLNGVDLGLSEYLINQSLEKNGKIKNKGNISTNTIFETGNTELLTSLSSGKISNNASLQFTSNGIVSILEEDLEIKNEGTIKADLNIQLGNNKIEYDKYYSGAVINGNVMLNGSANGIFITNFMKENIIVNDGLISSEIKIKTGNGTIIENQPSYRSLSIYNGISSNMSGNGVLSTFLKIGNKGVILGKNNLISGDNNLNDGLRNDYYSSSCILTQNSGNGILFFDSQRNRAEIINEGLILGETIANAGDSNSDKYSEEFVKTNKSGNGVSLFGLSKDSTDYIKNSGKIAGFVDINSGSSNKGKDLEEIVLSGNGVAINYNTPVEIYNSGIIQGSQSAIAGSSKIIEGTINNYGILAGKEIYSDGTEIIANDSLQKDDKKLQVIDVENENNYGIYIKFNDDEERTILSIENGRGGISDDGKNIINADLVGNNNSYIQVNEDKSYINNIINGAGVDKGTIAIKNSNVNIEDSIINAYHHAITLEGESSLMANNTTFNGGGIKGDQAVIKGDSSKNTLLIQESTINGDIDLSGGDDTLNISNSFINGNIIGGDGNDKLTLNNISIFNNINGFENIEFKGNSILFESSKIDSGNINIEDGNLNLRLDITDKDENGYIKGHALYKHTGDLTFGTDGNLVLGLNGLAKDSIIAMNGTEIINPTNPEDLWWKDNKVITNSLVLDGKLLEDGNIYVGVKEMIDLLPPITPDEENPSFVLDDLLYEKLNKIYKSIISSEEIGKLANTTLLDDKSYEEALGGLLTVLDQMYANNPYSYTLKSSKDSLKLFENNLSYFTIKPKEKEWIVQGKGIYSGIKTDNESNGKNYYGFDTGHRNYKTTTSTIGGIATYELGLSDNTSVGFALGGNNQNINYKGSSKIKGDSLYLGAFTKSNIDNFRLIAGLGYQYTKDDVNRNTFNKYDSFNNRAKYNVNSLNVFTELKYELKLDDSLSINPKTKLSLYHISQDSINEGYNNNSISMKVDEANNNTLDLELGFDVIKSFFTETGKVNNIISLSGVQMIGDESKELNGYVLGSNTMGSKFDIQGAKLPKTSGKISYDIEFEKNNGIIYTAGVAYTFSKANKDISSSIGVGYKFNQIQDLVPISIVDKISLFGTTNFEFNSSKVNEKGKEEIKYISKELIGLNNVSLELIGHTDSIGSEEYNRNLSLERAEEVKKEFEKNIVSKDIDIKTYGLGESQPLFDNKTSENRAKNRRVEINIKH